MPRILHLGLGNFHRAHQAWYTARANALDPGGPQWHITGIAMQSAGVRDALARQNGRYALGIRGVQGLQVEEITVHDRLLVAAETPAAVLEAMTDPDVQVITVTVTEKGYHLDGTTGRLDLAAAEIADDLAQDLPKTAIGLLARGLARRTKAGAGPVTVISCDNISGNGATLAMAVAEFARAAGIRIDPGTTFPDTMVDRITPATSPDIKAEIGAATGHPNAAPVMTEDFSEWVIEDKFVGPRPDWHRVGVEIVADVAPFERRKLRLLNAAHSYLAYAGQLAGCRYVHEAIASPALRDGVERLWDEAERTLPATLTPTLPAYRAALIRRFSVAGMRHELAQIGMDGSLKLRERLVPILTGLDGDAPQVTRAIAAWVAFLARTVRDGKGLTDPKADALAALVKATPQTDARVAALARHIGLGDAPQDWIRAIAAAVADYPTSS